MYNAVHDCKNKLGRINSFQEHAPEARLFKMLPSRLLDAEETDTASEDDDTPEMLPLPLSHIYREENRTLSNDDLEGYLIAVYDCLTISQPEADFLERSTRKQSRSEAWKIHRMGRLTASLFHRVATLKDSTSPTSLISHIMGYSSSISTTAMKWGIDHEEEARREFIGLEQQNHKNFSVRKSGLVVNNSWPYLGATPDGIAECSCCDRSVVEIKCPYKYRFSDIGQALCDKDFCIDRSNMLKSTHSYYYQLQGQMAIADVPSGYLLCGQQSQYSSRKLNEITCSGMTWLRSWSLSSSGISYRS